VTTAEADTRTSGVRSRLIDAAEACFRRFGVAKTTIEDIASEAMVSRATVYRHVGGRDELVLEVLLRSADHFYERLGRHTRRSPLAVDAIVEGVLYTLDAAQADPALMMLFAPEAIGVTTRIIGTSAAVSGRTAAQLRSLVTAGQATGELRDTLDVDELAQWLTRLVFSFLMLPGDVDSPTAIRSQLHRYLVPALAPDNSQ
jgi:AcrR family transcriptional regulator